MLRAIGRALMSAISGLWKNTLGVISWTEQLIRWPFSVIFGSGGGGAMPNPEYKPDVSGAQLLEEFEQTRQRQAAVHDLDRDGIATVIKYAKATPSARPTIDLDGLAKDVRATLLTMDDHELRALAQAGMGAVRKFIDGKPHGIHGVPVVAPLSASPAAPAPTMSAEERVLWKVRSRLLKAECGQEFKLAR